MPFDKDDFLLSQYPSSCSLPFVPVLCVFCAENLCTSVLVVSLVWIVLFREKEPKSFFVAWVCADFA
jgi:hypothetical protein